MPTPEDHFFGAIWAFTSGVVFAVGDSLSRKHCATFIDCTNVAHVAVSKHAKAGLLNAAS